MRRLVQVAGWEAATATQPLERQQAQRETMARRDALRRGLDEWLDDTRRRLQALYAAPGLGETKHRLKSEVMAAQREAWVSLAGGRAVAIVAMTPMSARSTTRRWPSGLLIRIARRRVMNWMWRAVGLLPRCHQPGWPGGRMPSVGPGCGAWPE